MESGPPRFLQNFTCSAVLRNVTRDLYGFAYRTITFYGGAVPALSATNKFCNSLPLKIVTPYNPPIKSGFGLFPFRSQLLREYGLYLFLDLLRCFSSVSSLHTVYKFNSGYPTSGVGCPIRKSPDKSLLTATRGLSQSTTSFIGQEDQGIH